MAKERLQPRNSGENDIMTGGKLPDSEFSEKIEEKTARTKSAASATLKGLAVLNKSNTLNTLMENFFRWLGETVCLHPIKVMVASLVFVGIGCLGLPFLYTENNMIRLWIPKESDFAANYAWLWSTHPPEFRQHSVILHGEDVLTPQAVQKMYRIYKDITQINTDIYNMTWEDACFRRPVLNISTDTFLSRKKREIDFDFDDSFENEFDAVFEEPSDYSVTDYPQPYCGIVESLPTFCFIESILELWGHEGGFDDRSDENIANLTKPEIIAKINDWGHSEIYHSERDFKPLLGGVTYDENGRIVAARAVMMKLMGRMNTSLALQQGGSNDAGTGELVDSKTGEFETALSKVLLEGRQYEPKQITVEVNVANSFSEIASATINTDVSYLIIGFCIVFTYVNIMLGRFNLVEQRAFISLMGLASISMALFFSYGVCSLAGLPFGPLHNIIPFLLMGVGIDDMFVTVQCFNNLSGEEKKAALYVQMGEAMSRAGTAITITSLTDFLAFMIGGTTILPALRSFCIFCGVGIFVVYILQATWFFAWFTLDERRIQQSRNGALPCYVHTGYIPNRLSQKNILQTVFIHLGEYLFLTPVKIFFIILTTTIFGISVWGNIELRQEFNPIWFLPPESYLAKWHQARATYFPSNGEQVQVFWSDLKLPEDLPKLESLHSEIANQIDIISSVDSWYTGFKDYMQKNFAEDGSIFELETYDLKSRLTQYLFSPHGAQYRFLFQFDTDIECGQQVPLLKMSMMTFQHKLMNGPTEQIPAMNRVKDIFKMVNFTSRAFPMAQGYAAWETDEVISEELYRNMGLALLCIFLMILFLLLSFSASLQVLLSVVLTLFNVAGFMHFWGLTIDTVSCTNLIISIGLCVDYSSHIAHCFLMCAGKRSDRAREALRRIGPAVFNGGFSTFLAVIMLATSKSHVFLSFFKVFFLVVVFGLYNGLIFLPLLLSVLGPRSFVDTKQVNFTEEQKEKTENEEGGVLLKPIIKHDSNVANGHSDTQSPST